MTPILFDPKTGDLAPLADLHSACFADPWTARAIGELLATPNCYLFSSGDGLVMARAAAGESEILTLAVAPRARRQGIGRTLVLAAAAYAQSLGATAMFLEVGADNLAALGLYGGLGFAPVGERKGYYGGRDALMLKAALPLSPGSKFA